MEDKQATASEKETEPDKATEESPVEKSEDKGSASSNGDQPCTPFVHVSEVKPTEAPTEKEKVASKEDKEPSKKDKEEPVKESRVRPYYPDQVCESALQSFMVALRPFQAPLKLQADDPTEFIPFLKDTTLAWINYRVDNLHTEAPKVAKSLGFSPQMVEAILKNRHSGYEDRETEMGLMLPAIRVTKLKVRAYHFLILMKDSLILTIHGQEVVRLVKFARYAETYMRKIPVNIPMRDKLTMLLERIIDENNERNFDGIRTIEEESDDVGKMLSDPKTPMVKLSPIIYEMKHALISYLNLLWDTQNVIHSLRYGDPELLSDDPDVLEKFEVLGEDVTRHIQLGENLSEVLASGLEVLQGIYNNQLQIINNKMALVLTWMTILGTALLVPNTIATAMGNTAYNLQPSDAWWYSILLIASTGLATWVSWLFLKKKGLLPKEIE
jgi:magnesium transporter